MRRQHPRVERKLADIVRYHGGRHCRYWGQGRVKVQYLLTGLVVNVKRMVKLLCPAGPSCALPTGYTTRSRPPWGKMRPREAAQKTRGLSLYPSGYLRRAVL